jgi:hypothetical protein
MKINITNIGNKEWMDFKSDISFGLYYALKELGHDVTMSVNQFILEKLNIIIGADFLVNDTKTVEQIISSKLEYVIYEVEKFDDFKINDRENFNTQSYRTLLEASKFIVTPYLFNFKSYARYFDSEKINYARWGFHESMVNKNISRSNNFEFNGLFFGLLKGLRLEKMRSLATNKNTNIKFIGRDDPLLFKDYYISSCKWGLNLSYGDTEKFINPFRLYSMGSNGMPILADGGQDNDDYLSLCKIADISDFESYLFQDVERSSDIIEQFRQIKLRDSLKDIF